MRTELRGAVLEDMKAWSDVELVRAARAGDDSFGCFLWLLAPLASMSLGFVYGVAVACLGFVVVLALCALVARLRQLLPRVRKGRLAQREFELRFGLTALEHYEAEARSALERPASLEAVLLFQGTSLPHGGHRFIRIELAAESSIQIRSTPFLRDLWNVAEPGARMLKLDTPLSAAAADRVRELLRELTAEQLIAPSHFVYDGFPCAAVVLLRAAEPLRTQMNLAGIPSELRGHPSVRLLTLVLELEAEVSGGAGRQLTGATSASGDIEITMR